MKVTLKELLEAGCHFGHQAQRWNPRMKPYIFTAREGIHIFDLAKTKEGLEKAAEFINEVVGKGGKILLVGTKRQARQPILDIAQQTKMPYVIQRWLGGMMTNWEQIKKSIDKLAQMKQEREAGEYKEFTKKEQLLIDRKILKFEKFLGGISSLDDLPAAIFVVDSKKENAAVREATRSQVPIIAMVDTNSDPELVDYPIPVNDDAAASIELVVGKIGEAIQEALGTAEKPKKSTAKKEKKNGDKA